MEPASASAPKSAHSQEGDRILALDGVRGVAILMVLLFHFTYGFLPTGGFSLAWRTLCEFGWSGVDLFFVLSGFLITGILRRQREEGVGLRVFYWRRVLRILPIYYGTLAAMLGFVLYFGNRLAELGFGPGSGKVWPWLFAHLGNFYFAAHATWPRPLGHLWSLGVEEQFYLVWPFVVMISRRSVLLVICGLGIVAAPFLREACLQSDMPGPAAQFLPYARMDTLLAGGLLALLLEDPEGLRRIRWPARIVGLLSGLGLALIIGVQGSPTHEGRLMILAGFSLTGLLFASLIAEILGSASGSRLRRISENPLLRAFGTYSYAIYIFHWPLFLAAEWFLFRKLQLGGPGVRSSFGIQLLFSAVFTGLLFCLGRLSWRSFESRILRFKTLFDEPRSRATKGAAGETGSPAVKV